MGLSQSFSTLEEMTQIHHCCRFGCHAEPAKSAAVIVSRGCGRGREGRAVEVEVEHLGDKGFGMATRSAFEHPRGSVRALEQLCGAPVGRAPGAEELKEEAPNGFQIGI